MPSLGLPLNYGAFTAVSMVVIMGAYNAWAGSIAIAADLAGPKTITYDLTLPLPYWMVWIKNGLYLSMIMTTLLKKLSKDNTFKII